MGTVRYFPRDEWRGTLRHRAVDPMPRERIESRPSDLSTDERHIAMPKLYGAPAYGRPPGPVKPVQPFDPDDLPLEVAQTEAERELAESLSARAYASGVYLDARDGRRRGRNGDPGLRPRPLSLKAIAGRLLRNA
jgi:hypothetical protein